MEPENESRRIEIKKESLEYLDITRKWTMFLAVLGFIGIGMMIIFGIAMSAMLPVLGAEADLGGAEVTIIMVIFLLISVLYFFPVLFLFRFSVHTKNAVKAHDPEQLSKGLKNLKSCFRYIGIFTIVVIALYILVFIFAGASAIFLNAF